MIVIYFRDYIYPKTWLHILSRLGGRGVGRTPGLSLLGRFRISRGSLIWLEWELRWKNSWNTRQHYQCLRWRWLHSLYDLSDGANKTKRLSVLDKQTALVALNALGAPNAPNAPNSLDGPDEPEALVAACSTDWTDYAYHYDGPDSPLQCKRKLKLPLC